MYFISDKILSVDLEATCWEPKNSKPIDEEQEIIEIGVSLINLKSLKIEKSEGIIVKPVRSKISKFCTDLTTLTQEQVDNGLLFKDACERLKKEFESKKTNWLGWGDYDRTFFNRQCIEYDVEYPFGNRYINLKHIMSVMYGLPKEFGLANAMKFLEIDFTGTHHRGVDDAFNTAKIFIKMLERFRKAG